MGLLHLLDDLKTKDGFAAQAHDHSWSVPLEVRSTRPLSIVTPNLFALPISDAGLGPASK